MLPFAIEQVSDSGNFGNLPPSLERARRPLAQGVHDALTVTPLEQAGDGGNSGNLRSGAGATPTHPERI